MFYLGNSANGQVYGTSTTDVPFHPFLTDSHQHMLFSECPCRPGDQKRSSVVGNEGDTGHNTELAEIFRQLVEQGKRTGG